MSMTTSKFDRFAKSMEGQFQIKLSRLWADEIDDGEIERIVADDPIKIGNAENLVEPKQGWISENAANSHIFNVICRRVECKPITQCINHFKPFGHCCSVCGSKIEFNGHNIDINEIRLRIVNVLYTHKFLNHLWSVEKTSNGSTEASYQIVLIPEKDDSFNEYDVESLTTFIIDNLKIGLRSGFIGEMETTLSKYDKTIMLKSKIIGLSIVGIIVLICIAIYMTQHTDRNVSNYIPNVLYKRSSLTGEQLVQLEMNMEKELESEEEDDTIKQLKDVSKPETSSQKSADEKLEELIES